jgi:hypothetical protein
LNVDAKFESRRLCRGGLLELIIVAFCNQGNQKLEFVHGGARHLGRAQQVSQTLKSPKPNGTNYFGHKGDLHCASTRDKGCPAGVARAVEVVLGLKNGSYQGIASAMPTKAQKTIDFSRSGLSAAQRLKPMPNRILSRHA